MLYNFSWLAPGMPFPPLSEEPRIMRYYENETLFNNEHFSDPIYRTRGDSGTSNTVSLYDRCAERIQRVVGNFEEFVSFPVILGYQRLMSLKMADLVCGEPPSITSSKDGGNARIKEARERSEFDSKLFSTVIDLSRFGDAVWRVYLDDHKDITFTCWDPKEWYPIIAQDGTNRILYHCIAWRENKSDRPEAPDWYLHIQIHGTSTEDIGEYKHRVYRLDSSGTAIKDLAQPEETVSTGLKSCAVIHLKSFATSTSVYGYDDYMPIDSLLAEIMERIAQISVILDKHADPSISGPSSMLTYNDSTGEFYLKHGSFFATAPGENDPKYMVWDGQLTSAFKQLELLINQLYILSEMGDALLGGAGGGGQAISGTAMRFKMVNPLAKARRLGNSLKISVKRLFSAMSKDTEYDDIGIEWFDGLPDDPKENAEIAKIVTGANKMMPLKDAIREYFGRTDSEAEAWIKQIEKETEASMALSQVKEEEDNPLLKNPNHPGPQDGTGVNPQKSGSEMGLKNFTGLNTKTT